MMMFHSNRLVSTATSLIRRFNIVMICAGLSTTVLATFPALRSYSYVLNIVAFITAGFFALEYATRLVRARQQSRLLRYLFSFLGLVDLLSVLPFLLPSLLEQDTIAHTGIIYCRLLLIFKLQRYWKSFDLLAEAVSTVKKPLIAAISLPLAFAFMAALFFYYTEAPLQPDKLKSLTDAFYWVVITMATVGYGDLVPVTDLGKVLSIFTALCGIFIIALPSGLLSSAFINIIRSRTENRGKARGGSSRAEITHVCKGKRGGW